VAGHDLVGHGAPGRLCHPATQAGYELNDHVQFNLNVANATNHSYLTSLYWTQAYYAAPRNVTGSVRVTF
jgi:outer membrane receptor for ferric coprogen and ferric-rhodotorulic acid